MAFLGINRIGELPAYLLTFFTIMLVINSFNLIDGVDGLAACLGLISCVTFGLYFFINNNVAYAMLGFFA